jgi:sugar phosphate isomerase/epimerase
VSESYHGDKITRRGFLGMAGVTGAGLAVAPVLNTLGDDSGKYGMRYGLTAWGLTPAITEENAGEFFNQISKLDIPGERKVIEVFASHDPNDLRYARTIRDMADDKGFDVVACGFNPSPDPPYDGPRRPRFLCSDDIGEWKAAVEKVAGFIDYAATVCAKSTKKVMSGPWHTEHKNFTGKPLTEDEKGRLIEGFQAIDSAARDKGVYMALEPLNRFETYVLCTVGDAVRVIEKAGTKYIGINWDSTHAWTQEKDFMDSLEMALRKGLLGDVHLSENHREEFGTGQIGETTTDVLKMLKKYDYEGAADIELFCPEFYGIVQIPNQPPAKGAYAVARDSLAYLNWHVKLFQRLEK